MKELTKENKLDKWETLLVRACKSGRGFDKTIRRLRKIWRIRCGLPYEYMEKEYDCFIAEAMIELLQKRKHGYSATKLLYALNPYYYWKNDIEVKDSYWIKVIKAVKGEILVTSPREEWSNFHSPLKFRKRRE